VATIDPNFRADINRSVQIFGDLTDDLVGKLAVEILKLRSPGENPITVFINSNGGVVRCGEFIYDFLSSKTTSGKVCRKMKIR